MGTKIKDEYPTRAAKALAAAGFHEYEDLDGLCEVEIIRIRGLGLGNARDVIARARSLGVHIRLPRPVPDGYTLRRKATLEAKIAEMQKELDEINRQISRLTPV